MTLIYDFLSRIGFAPEGPGEIMTEQVVPCAPLGLSATYKHYISLYTQLVPYKDLEGIKKHKNLLQKLPLRSGGSKVGPAKSRVGEKNSSPCAQRHESAHNLPK